jgi:hypothetical protein
MKIEKKDIRNKVYSKNKVKINKMSCKSYYM